MRLFWDKKKGGNPQIKGLPPQLIHLVN